jgi:hypothetical protein
MSTDRDTPRIVRSWIREDEYVSASRILDNVLDIVDTTPQRRHSLLARRPPFMSNTVRLVLGVAAVVVVALLGYQFFIAPNVGGPGPSPSPTAEPTPSPVPSAAVAFPPSGELAVGRHSFRGAAPFSLEFTTAGWVSNGEWGIDKGDFESGTADAASFIFWTDSAPDMLYADPCAQTPLSPPVGQSAAELAAAVANVPGTELVSGPSEITLDGHPAQHVVFTVPDTIACTPNEFYLWEDTDNPGASRYASEVGETFYIWIIDVDGTLVWIDGETYVESSSETAQEVQQIVNSIQFE